MMIDPSKIVKDPQNDLLFASERRLYRLPSKDVEVKKRKMYCSHQAAVEGVEGGADQWSKISEKLGA